MSIGHPGSFQASRPSVSASPAPASDLLFKGGTKQCGGMRKGCDSGSSLFSLAAFPFRHRRRCLRQVRCGSIRNCSDPSRLSTRNFCLRSDDPNRTLALRLFPHAVQRREREFPRRNCPPHLTLCFDRSRPAKAVSFSPLGCQRLLKAGTIDAATHDRRGRPG